jgi:probable addiction module antidote protein
LRRRLQDNSEALHYLCAALEDSRPAFLTALRNVLEARNLSEVARSSKLNRVHLYRMLDGSGNPTLGSLEKVLGAVGLRLTIALKDEAGPESASNASDSPQEGPEKSSHAA